MNREEILKVCEEGPEAVVKVMQALFDRIAQLEGQLNKNSQNSSKPPSTDGFKKPVPKSLREKGKNPVGGQTGHLGKTLCLTEQPDQVIVHRIDTCSCGHDLEQTDVDRQERRQVWDIPPLIMEVTEHQAQVKRCPRCGKLNKAEFPAGVNAPVQYGAGANSLMSYLSQYQLLPFDRIREFFVDTFGQNISPATVIKANTELYEQLADTEKDIMSQIIKSEVVHFDETGIRVNKTLHWLHAAGTNMYTYYFVDAKRGTIGMDAAGILLVFFGIAVHDAWAPYWKYPCRHALCNAHLLRELTFLVEQEGRAWAKEMIALLIEIKKRVDERKASDDSLPLDRNEAMAFVQRYRQLLETGFAEEERLHPQAFTTTKKRGRIKQSTGKNLLDRLAKHMAEYLTFMHDFRVPFDNNLAERDIRMVKVQQKVSGTFRVKQGAEIFCRIRGVISTLKKQSLSVMEGIRAAFEGKAPLPPVSL